MASTDIDVGAVFSLEHVHGELRVKQERDSVHFSGTEAELLTLVDQMGEALGRDEAHSEALTEQFEAGKAEGRREAASGLADDLSMQSRDITRDAVGPRLLAVGIPPADLEDVIRIFIDWIGDQR